MLGDVAQHVAAGEQPQPAAPAVDQRHVAVAVHGHRVDGVGQPLVEAQGERLRRHQLADRRRRVGGLERRAVEDVALGEDADDPLAVADHHGVAPLPVEQLVDLTDRRVGGDGPAHLEPQLGDADVAQGLFDRLRHRETRTLTRPLPPAGSVRPAGRVARRERHLAGDGSVRRSGAGPAASR